MSPITRTCRTTGKTFEVSDFERELLAKLAPVVGGVRLELPLPTLAPDERLRRLLAWRNLSSVYRRTCDATGQDRILMYAPGSPFKVYGEKEWYGGGWDPATYGRDFDFSRPFFEQFAQLMLEVPRLGRSVVVNENSEYTNNVHAVKNCYLVFGSGETSDCYYSSQIVGSRDCCDCSLVSALERCYECVNCHRSSRLSHAWDSHDSRDGKWLRSCDGCSDCWGCANLRNKKFHAFNEPLEEPAYRKRVAELEALPVEEQARRFEAFAAGFENVTARNQDCEGCEGTMLTRCKDVRNGFQVLGGRDMANVFLAYDADTCVDYANWGNGARRVARSSQVGNGASEISMSESCFNDVARLLYCQLCVTGVMDCFGCVGLHSGEKYHVLNRKYSKEEYEALVPKIVEHMRETGEWGEFFPQALCPFGYNEAMAQDVFPLARDQALAAGYPWCDYVPPMPKVAKTVPGDRLPENVADVPDDVLNWAVVCAATGRPFRIVAQELAFYRKNGIPLPRLHPDERRRRRQEKIRPRG